MLPLSRVSRRFSAAQLRSLLTAHSNATRNNTTTRNITTLLDKNNKQQQRKKTSLLTRSYEGVATSSILASSSSSSSSSRSFSSSVPPAGSSPLTLYEATIASGQLREDARQRQTVMLLEETFQKLVTARANGGAGRSFVSAPAAAAPVTPVKTNGSSSGGFFGFAKKFLSNASSNSSSSSSSSSSFASSSSSSSSPFHGIPGLYLHGGVGAGKTMLMNQFFDCLTPELVSRKVVRKHFHSFMLDIHRRLHELRRSQPHCVDPIGIVARNFVRDECEVLALDEFQVTDVADAMILKQLFGIMWSEGCVMVATSNRPPEELYKNGLNRGVFLPFIDELKTHCIVHAIQEGQDHRLLGTIAEGMYHTPLSSETHASMEKIFEHLAGSDRMRRGPTKIPVMMGRELYVPMASMNNNVARFSFTQLCESNVGAADYIALVQRYKYILLTDIPILYFHQREKIRRFITFLDVAYEHHTRLIMQADAKPLDLFRAPTSEMVSGLTASSSNSAADGGAKEFEGIAPTTVPSTPTPTPSVGATSSATTAGAKYDEQFASSRAISRLIEMSSQEYLEACSKVRDQSTNEFELKDGSRSQQHLETERQQGRQQRA